MLELYWLTRISAFREGLLLLEIITPFALILIPILLGLLEIDNDAIKDKYIKFCKKCAIGWFIGLIVLLFLPSRKELFLIYGVGGTIDYIKSNDKAKQLPDKCIDALDKWVESLNDKDK